MFVPDRRLRLGDAESLRGTSPDNMKKEPKANLRSQYAKVLEISMIVAISLSIVAFRFFPDFKPDHQLKVEDQEIIEFEDIDHTRQEEKPPPPPRPPIAIEAPTDDVLDNIDFFSSELDLLEDVPPPAPPPAEDDDEFGAYFVAVETMPEIIGGIQSLARNLVYPELARRAGVEGTVFILAYVDEKGTVQRTEIARGIGAGCDEAAAEAVAKAKFKPGLQRGQPVKVRVMVPVRFSLRQSAER